MRVAMQEDVEALLRREFRSRLPFARQLRIYLDPFALFKDVAAGRERALSYNRALRWVLIGYLRRWILITLSLFVGIAPAEALAAQATIVPAAAIAVGSCIAATVAVCTAAAYILLGVKRR